MRKEKKNLFEVMAQDIASTIPWWAAFGAALLFYFLFNSLSGIQIQGGLVKHPILSILIAFCGLGKILLPALFIIGGIANLILGSKK